MAVSFKCMRKSTTNKKKKKKLNDDIEETQSFHLGHVSSIKAFGKILKHLKSKIQELIPQIDVIIKWEINNLGGKKEKNAKIYIQFWDPKMNKF